MVQNKHFRVSIQANSKPLQERSRGNIVQIIGAPGVAFAVEIEYIGKEQLSRDFALATDCYIDGNKVFSAAWINSSERKYKSIILAGLRTNESEIRPFVFSIVELCEQQVPESENLKIGTIEILINRLELLGEERDGVHAFPTPCKKPQIWEQDVMSASVSLGTDFGSPKNCTSSFHQTVATKIKKDESCSHHFIFEYKTKEHWNSMECREETTGAIGDKLHAQRISMDVGKSVKVEDEQKRKKQKMYNYIDLTCE